MPRRLPRSVGIVAVLMGIILLAFQLTSPADTFSTSQRIVVASGQAGGVYDQFTRSLPDQLRLPISSINTAGSLENIELLRSRKADYAIVQSDIAHYSYLGERQQPRFDDLALITPLFPEYVQILVPEGSGIAVLSDLKGKRICIGQQGSGTYFNSIDVLAEAGIRESIDFMPVNGRTSDCLRDMQSGGNVDVVFATSNHHYVTGDAKLRQLYLSDAALRSLTARHPYFRTERVVRDGKVVAPQLAVDALLVTHNDQSSASVYAVTRRLIGAWDALGKELTALIRPREHDHRQLIPYHSSALSALISLGVQKRDYYLYTLIGAWTLFLLVCLIAEGAKNSYNRLGESTISALGYSILVKHVGRISHLFIGLTTLFLFFVIAVYLLFSIEDSYAQQMGAVSPFTTMDFLDSILWLFTYIASGFTADGIYPVSIPGKIIVAILAIVGLIAPITGVIFVINMASRRAQKQLQGLGRTDLKNHLVICGWNEKVPGLIYTLTGKDVDRRMKVVLVADPQDKYPLEKFKFNPRYVSFCRGDTADASVLHRASIEGASVIIVLADFVASKSHNRKSILTAMIARRANERAYICAELEYIDNVDFYQASGCSSVIYTSLIISRLATATILNPLILDYVLDVITYHEFDELRSAGVSDFEALSSEVGRSIREVQDRLLRQGVNLVGVMHATDRTNLHDAAFGRGEQAGALLHAKDREAPLDAADTLIYSSEHENISFRSEAAIGDFRPLGDRLFGISYPRSLKVLVCADAETIAVLERGLAHVIDDLKLVKIDIDREPLRYIDQLDAIAPGEFDRVVILASQARRSELASFDDLNEIDAELILTTRLVKEAFRLRGAAPTIISEISSIKNKPLIIESGADVVLPALLATERFLAKEAYDRNNVTDFLMAALNLEDGIHLHNHRVRDGDGFCGERYSDILATPIDGLRVMGWLPCSERDALKNVQDDFGYHFRTVIDQRIHHLIAESGDEIIMMIEKRSEYGRSDHPRDDVPESGEDDKRPTAPGRRSARPPRSSPSPRAPSRGSTAVEPRGGRA